MGSVFKISSINALIGEDDKKEKLYKREVRDLARGFCGALFLAVPLHFTMEMWARAQVIPNWDVVIIIIAAYFANVGFHLFSGFKPELKRQAIWFDALVSLLIGFIASVITLFLIDQFSFQMPIDTMLKIISLQMVPTSFGASLAKSQLGSRGKQTEKDVEKLYSDDFKKLMGSLLGAIMFSFNIAATQEPIVITTSINSYQILGLIIFSLFVSWMMVFMAGFIDRDEHHKGIMSTKWAETIISYVISLLVSAVLLWMFGYLTPSTPIEMALSWIVVLGYCTSLGSSAGRLVIS